MDADATRVGRVGPYVLLRELGRGGMATVHEARHVELGKHVALKLLARDIADNAVARERFAREGRAAVRIRHPNVVDVTDVGVCEGVPYLVLELVDGPTLSTVFAEGPLPLSRLVELFLPIVSAMHRAHAVGVVHRDLKPANVLLTRDLRGELVPKVGDFGISKVLSPGEIELTKEHGVVGTLLYMSPEQIRAAATVDGRSDQWSIGVMLYQGATAKAPFSFASSTELMHAILHEEVLPPSRHQPRLPEAFDRLVLRALSRDPSARFSDMRALGVALLELAEGRGWSDWAREFETPGGETADASVAADPTVSAHTPPPTSRRGHARGRMLAGVLAIGGVVAAGLAVREGTRPAPAQPAVVSTAPSAAPVPAASSPASVLPPPAPSVSASTSAKPRPTVALPQPVPVPSPKPTMGANGAPILE